MQLIFVSALGYHVTIMVLKSTFLLQFRRVFPLPAFQRLCNIFLVFLAVWTVAGIVGGATICLPLNWDPREPTWTFEKRFWFWTGYGIVHVITDILIFLMPLPLLKTLPLPPLYKMVLIGVFCLGFLYVLFPPAKLRLRKASNFCHSTCVISAVRLTTLHAALQGRDFSWTSAKTVFWSVGEVTSSIVCLCIPTLRPLLGSCCSCRPSGEDLAESGTQRFEIYAPSLSSTLGPRSPTVTGAEKETYIISE
jgi:hypothetical protein